MVLECGGGCCRGVVSVVKGCCGSFVMEGCVEARKVNDEMEDTFILTAKRRTETMALEFIRIF